MLKPTGDHGVRKGKKTLIQESAEDKLTPLDHTRNNGKIVSQLNTKGNLMAIRNMLTIAGLELIDFYYLLDGKRSFLMWFRGLPCLLSNHSPILLDCGDRKRRGGYFKFENMWLKSEEFVDQMKIWWQSYQFNGSPSYVLACKLKALKGDLQQWNNEVFRHVGKREKMLLDGIMELDIRGEGQGLNEGRTSKDELPSELERMLLCEEIS